MQIRCVVSCRDANGSPDFFACVLTCTQKQYDEGNHYDMAKEAALDARYESPGIVYDENDGPDWLFANLFK